MKKVNKEQKAKLEDNLSLPLEIEERNWSGFFNHMMVGVIVFFVSLLAIAAYAPINEVAVAMGQITPKENVVRVEHFEGGIVEKINYKIGDKINQGDVIMQLKPVMAESEQDQLLVRERSLVVSKIRLEALLNNRVPDYSSIKASPEMIKENRALYFDAKMKMEHTLDALQSRIEQKQTQINALEYEVTSLKTQVGIQQEQYKIKNKLVKEGYTSKVSYLDAKARLQESHARLEAVKGQYQTALKSLEESRSQLEQSKSAERQVWSEELSKTIASLEEVKASMRRVSDKVQRLEVRSPVTGIVQDLAVKGRNEVVNPGDMVAEVVPNSEQLIAEVRLMPNDINEVAVGNPANVHITAFDPKDFPPIKGNLIAISPSTSQDEKGNYYYLARLSLSKEQLKRKGIVHPMKTGMVVRAELIKGERSVLRYMLHPVLRAMDNSFGEH